MRIVSIAGSKPLDALSVALERARRENPSFARDPKGEVLHSAFVPRGPTTIRPAADFDRGPIVYSRTRVNPVSAERLRSRYLFSDGIDPSLAQAVRRLRGALVDQMRQRGWTTVGVVSPLAGDGRSFTATNLALAIAAEQGQTSLLVDADLRSPSIHDYFGLPMGPGLAHYLTGDVPLESLLVNPGIPRMVVLPAGQRMGQAAELLRSPRMTGLVTELRSRYSNRIIVFDLPAALAHPDALAIAPALDALVMVARSGRSSRYDVARVCGMLGRHNLVGVVLNDARAEDDNQPLVTAMPGTR